MTVRPGAASNKQLPRTKWFSSVNDKLLSAIQSTIISGPRLAYFGSVQKGEATLAPGNRKMQCLFPTLTMQTMLEAFHLSGHQGLI
jgi:hypothetical protein